MVQLHRSGQVNNSATVTLSGGTITRGSGVSEVFGNLNLTQSSFLDFGSGATGNLTFGTYAPGALLTINNFGLGNTLVFGSDLRSTINNSSFFSFTNGGIGSSSWNEGTSTFTITAIPKTSTYVAAVAGRVFCFPGCAAGASLRPQAWGRLSSPSRRLWPSVSVGTLVSG